MNLRNSLLRGFVPAVSALALAAMVSIPAQAASIVTNGSFDASTGSYQINETANKYGNNCPYYSTCQALSGWTNNGGYSFVMNSTTSAHGVNDTYGDTVKLYSVPTSPDGGNFAALDADTGYNGQLSQTLSLTANDQYTLSFDYAADQQIFTNPAKPGTTVTLEALLNGNVIWTSNGLAVDNDFVGCGTNDASWCSASINFTAGSGSNTISFLAMDGSSNVPGFALIDGVNVNPAPAPEPSSLILLGTGLAGLGGFVRSRFMKTAKDNA